MTFNVYVFMLYAYFTSTKVFLQQSDSLHKPYRNRILANRNSVTGAGGISIPGIHVRTFRGQVFESPSHYNFIKADQQITKNISLRNSYYMANNC